MAERRTRIVVAEDDEATLELLVTRLEIHGYQAFAARDGRRALEAISLVRPHGMVLDLGMPNLDGFGVLRALRDSGRLQSVPVLVLTGMTTSDCIRMAIGLGASDYLAKPFESAKLLARLARITSQAR